MKRLLSNLLATCLAATFVLAALPVATASAGDDRAHEIRLRDGSRWRGTTTEQVEVVFVDQGIDVKITGELVKVADLYITVKGMIAGEIKEKTIFRDDIAKMKTVDVSANPVKVRADRGARRSDARNDEAAPKTAEGKPLGVFFLPLEGPVGETLRHQEIDMIGEHADKFGPGQIIVLHIKSNGGLVYEAELINESIEAVRKRHRVIAWVNKAISAGCSTAMSCDEIYMQTNAVAGSVTTIRGLTHVPEAELQKAMEHMARLAEKNGMSEHIAKAMKLKKYMVSYDKDPVTGEITWYGDLSGEFVLSDGQSNLCFNAQNAEHSGFSSGTADTVEDLAKLLDLPKWHEIDDKGRRIAKDWQETVAQVKADIPRIMARMQYKNTGGGDPIEILGTRIKLVKDLLRCYDRADLVSMMTLGVERDYWERQLEEMRKQLGDMRRRNR